MILGISHITINSVDLDNDIKVWETKGYKTSFINRDIPNSPSKKAYLKNYSDKHSIALLKKPNANNIELIQHHDKLLGQNDLYQFKGEVIGVNCSDYKKSLEFWQNGLNLSKEGDLLVKSFPLQQMSGLFRLNSAPQKSCWLDYQGITCIAFFSTSLAADVEALRKDFAMEVSPKIELKVNGQALEIFMLKGPSGEMVELLQFSGL